MTSASYIIVTDLRYVEEKSAVSKTCFMPMIDIQKNDTSFQSVCHAIWYRIFPVLDSDAE